MYRLMMKSEQSMEMLLNRTFKNEKSNNFEAQWTTLLPTEGLNAN